MSKVQEYLKQKHIKELGLPKMYVVKSSPEGVELPREEQVTEIKKDFGVRHYSNQTQEKFDRYIMGGQFPYEADIVQGKTDFIDTGSGSGVGDLWSWSYFCTLSEKDAKDYYEKELKRVTDKYLTKFEFHGDERTWKETFENQTDNGKFWKNLHKEDFDRQRFLMREDVHHIIHKAQSDILKKIAADIEANPIENPYNAKSEIIKRIIKAENELWNNMHKE